MTNVHIFSCWYLLLYYLKSLNSLDSWGRHCVVSLHVKKKKQWNNTMSGYNGILLHYIKISKFILQVEKIKTPHIKEENWYGNTATLLPWNTTEAKDSNEKQPLMPIHNQHFNPLNPNPNKHLICSTKTPQLCYKLESSSLRSIRFLLGLWYLSWRPWWWESAVNRLSFYTELLLYEIIDSEKKNPCWGAFVVGSIGKTAASSQNMAFILKCNFTSSSTDNNHLFCSNNGCLPLCPVGRPVWNNGVAEKVTGNLKRQRGKLWVSTAQL